MKQHPDLPTVWHDLWTAFFRDTGLERLCHWFLEAKPLNRSALIALNAVVIIYVGASVLLTIAG